MRVASTPPETTAFSPALSSRGCPLKTYGQTHRRCGAVPARNGAITPVTCSKTNHPLYRRKCRNPPALEETNPPLCLLT
ncbi:unnamed protein product [Larinioides sclopetarius]|uniref:Uncharacterized protein n=1 Tax=Larinioides sclopetarius TaxID=280406 RepID=A0AAV2A4P3_9ARAC